MFEQRKGKWQVYVPVWLLPIFLVIGLGLVFGVFLLAQHQRSSLVTVSQKEIAKVSAPARAYPQAEASGNANGKFTIIIYYEGYDNPEDGQRFVGLAQAALKNVEPFATAGNVQTRVFTSASPKCHVEKGAKSLLVCDKSLINEVNALGIERFKLAVISPLNFVPNAKVARGKNSAFYLSTYQGALTQTELDQFVTTYFMHELGHSLGLRDEYIRDRPEKAIGDSQAAAALSSNIAFQPAQPNCAPDEATAKKWWGGYIDAKVADVGYFKGCAGRADYVFPQQSTLMSDDPTMESYGRVSEDYMRGVLACFYGDKDNVSYPGDTKISSEITSCPAFIKQYPGFWLQ